MFDLRSLFAPDDTETVLTVSRGGQLHSALLSSALGSLRRQYAP